MPAHRPAPSTDPPQRPLLSQLKSPCSAPRLSRKPPPQAARQRTACRRQEAQPRGSSPPRVPALVFDSQLLGRARTERSESNRRMRRQRHRHDRAVHRQQLCRRAQHSIPRAEVRPLQTIQQAIPMQMDLVQMVSTRRYCRMRLQPGTSTSAPSQES